MSLNLYFTSRKMDLHPRVVVPAPSVNNSIKNACDLPTVCELATGGMPVPSGWLLFEGELRLRAESLAATLCVETEGAKGVSHRIYIPIRRNGTIFQLIRMPKAVRKLIFEPSPAIDDPDLVHVSIKPVNLIVRLVLMCRRILYLFLTKPRLQRNKAELFLYTPLINLVRAYEIAGQFIGKMPELSYAEWIANFDNVGEADRRLIDRNIRRRRLSVNFKVVIACSLTDPSLKQTLDSLSRQLYRSFRVLLITASHEHNAELSLDFPEWVEVLNAEKHLAGLFALSEENQKTSNWIIPAMSGVTFSEHMLYWFAAEIEAHSDAGLIYSDHDLLDSDERRIEPEFKPDWTLELLRSTNYIGTSYAARSDVVTVAGGLSLNNNESLDCHDLLLRISETLKPAAIRHVYAPLWHISAEKRKVNILPDTNKVAQHLERLHVPAKVRILSKSHCRIQYELPKSSPLVSIIVPTRDALEYLKNCIESVLDKSTYGNFELVIVDNNSSEPETLIYLDELKSNPKVSVLNYAHPFNYSAINNFAVSQVKGEVLCFLNNDTEVITPSWMEGMVGHLIQDYVGIVGAKLYFSDGRVQHAGDVVGPGGGADHIHSLIDREDPGYCNRAQIAQDLSAVTAACMMTWRNLYLELGGFNEEKLAVQFNDVDYCLRMREAGYRVVWTPYSELYHHESVSRGKDNDPDNAARAKREVAYMRSKWKQQMRHDPFYNPNLNYGRPDFSLSYAPRVKKPWL